MKKDNSGIITITLVNSSAHAHSPARFIWTRDVAKGSSEYRKASVVENNKKKIKQID